MSIYDLHLKMSGFVRSGLIDRRENDALFAVLAETWNLPEHQENVNRAVALIGKLLPAAEGGPVGEQIFVMGPPDVVAQMNQRSQELHERLPCGPRAPVEFVHIGTLVHLGSNLSQPVEPTDQVSTPRGPDAYQYPFTLGELLGSKDLPIIHFTAKPFAVSLKECTSKLHSPTSSKFNGYSDPKRQRHRKGH